MSSLLPAPPAPPSAKALEYRLLATRKTAQVFIRRHHYLHSTPAGDRLRIGVYYAGVLVGVMMFGRPVARCEDQVTTLELTRMVLLDSCPRNSESRSLGQAVRIIRQAMPTIRRLIAYADPEQGHAGTIYKAAGWRCMGLRGGNAKWSNRPGRSGGTGKPKIKFEKLI